MSVKIRMRRVGGKNEPSFRVVVTDIRSQRDGAFIENVGFYNPVKGERKINLERIEYWISKGAKPSETVQSMIDFAKKAGAKQDPAPQADAEKAVCAP